MKTPLNGLAPFVWMAVVASLLINVVAAYLAPLSVLTGITTMILYTLPTLWILYEVGLTREFKVNANQMIVGALTVVAVVALATLGPSLSSAGVVQGLITALMPLAYSVGAASAFLVVVGAVRFYTK